MMSKLLCVVAAVASVQASAQPKPIAAARLTGRVITESALRPIADAEVSLPELSRSLRSDEKGAFTINDIAPGTYTVIVRRIGYARFESRVAFRSGKTEDRIVVLPPVAVLDSMRVVGEMNVPLSFLEHRHVGIGHFFTRAQLAEQENISLQNILSQIPSAAILRGRSTQAWLMSKRTVPRLSSLGRRGTPNIDGNTPGDDMYNPTRFELQTGMLKGCYARVYIDNLLLNPSTPADPINLNDFAARGLEAVEYYAGPSETPTKYSRLNTTCGVLVLHTRRSP